MFLPQFLLWLARVLANRSPANAEAASVAIHALSNRAMDYLRLRVSKAWVEDLVCQEDSPHFKNVFYEFGHWHLRLTQAAVTGATLAALAAREKTPEDVTPYRFDRKI